MEMLRPRVSYADLERMPEDGRRYELYDGEVFVVPAPILRHQIVAQRVWRILDDYARVTVGLAVISPMDVIFSEFNVVQPDVLFIRAAKMNTVSLDSRVEQAPDIAVEVLSPSTASNDRGRKMQMFQRYEVPEYWIVDPVAETIEIYSLADGRYGLARTISGAALVQSEIAPDLSFIAAAIFPDSPGTGDQGSGIRDRGWIGDRGSDQSVRRSDPRSPITVSTDPQSPVTDSQSPLLRSSLPIV